MIGNVVWDPNATYRFYVFGDFDIDNMSVEKTIDHVAAMVSETAATGAIPMIVGGDTSMLYPGVKGVAETHGSGSFGLLHFSAHPDAERFSAHTMSDSQASISARRIDTLSILSPVDGSPIR